MFEFNGWQFSTAIPSVLASSIIFCLSVYLSVRTWSKNGKKKKVAALELVRTLSVLFLLITLLNPEKIEEIKKNQKPDIICLLDESKSMDTKDTIDSNGTLTSRFEWAKNILKMDSISAVKEIMKYSSMPSTSRHHWGTDIDLNSLENSYFEKGEGKKIFDWLVANAFKYGFHMTYDNQIETKRTGYKMEKWHWSYMPISKQFLIQFNEYVKCENISSFKGSKFACHPKVDVIKNFVNGINTDFKKILNVTK